MGVKYGEFEFPKEFGFHGSVTTPPPVKMAAGGGAANKVQRAARAAGALGALLGQRVGAAKAQGAARAPMRSIVPGAAPPAVGTLPSAGPAMPSGAPVMKKGGKFIQKMHMKKGALHAQLGVPKGEKIPAKKLDAAASGRYGKLAEKRAHTAEMLKGLHHGK